MHLDNILEACKQQQKFLFARQPTESPRLFLFNFYAVNLYSKEEPNHETIAEAFEISPTQILGGGIISCPSRPPREELVIYDSSGSYGSIPRRFLEFFCADLLNQYNQRPEYAWLKKLVFNVPESSENEQKVDFLDELQTKKMKR